MTQALTDAFDLVEARFAADGRDVLMELGWRAKEKHNLSRPRIVWQPGDAGASLGVAGSNISAGQSFPLTYGTLWQTVTLYISAPSDPASPDDERKQWTNTMELRNALIIAFTKSLGTPQYRIESERYETQVGRRAQVTIVSVVSFRDDIQDDQSVGLEQVDATADVTLEELDVTEEFSVPSP